MILIWGTKLCGKVDEIPGLCYVVTKFGHLWYLPILPMGTHAVFGKEGRNYRSVELPFSLKSMLVAWLRTACVLALIVGFFAGIAGNLSGWGAAGGGLVLLVLSYTLPSISRASYERACEIARHIGLPDEAQLLLDLQYGRVDPEAAAEELELLAAQEERRAAARARAAETKRREREARRTRQESGRLASAASSDRQRLRARAPQRRRRLSGR